MEENKTAVEWLKNILDEGSLLWGMHQLDVDELHEAFAQAKEMEKKQIVMAYDYHRCFGDFEHGELYYKENFENNDKK